MIPNSGKTNKDIPPLFVLIQKTYQKQIISSIIYKILHYL